MIVWKVGVKASGQSCLLLSLSSLTLSLSLSLSLSFSLSCEDTLSWILSRASELLPAGAKKWAAKDCFFCSCHRCCCCCCCCWRCCWRCCCCWYCCGLEFSRSSWMNNQTSLKVQCVCVFVTKNIGGFTRQPLLLVVSCPVLEIPTLKSKIHLESNQPQSYISRLLLSVG